jgi:ABC-type multidrug transport system fused ATPase/permease subunit
VAVLDNGRIVETGSPQGLLSRADSRFAGLARAQLITDGFNPEGKHRARGRA